MTHSRSDGADASGAVLHQSESRRAGLADELREHTRSLHAKAERAGILHDLIRGRACREGYALFLRNLLPAYQALERELERHKKSPGVRAIRNPAVYRARALASDLESLCGRTWRESLPLLPAGESYTRRIAAAAENRGTRLIAHAYVRYLGDLNGGQILRQLLIRSLAFDARNLSFYAFPSIADLEEHKAAYRNAFDRAAREIGNVDAVITEAAVAFRLNIQVSEAVQDFVARAQRTTWTWTSTPAC